MFILLIVYAWGGAVPVPDLHRCTDRFCTLATILYDSQVSHRLFIGAPLLFVATRGFCHSRWWVQKPNKVRFLESLSKDALTAFVRTLFYVMFTVPN